MIDVKVIASGSKGNCTVLTSGESTILLDAGIRLKAIQAALNFKNPSAVLITHEHGDHAHPSTVREFLKRGVEVMMTHGTARALKLEPRHNLIECSANVTAMTGNCFISCEPVQHDAAEPVSFTIRDGDDCAVYITDTGEVCAPDGRPPSWYDVTKLLIEANHDGDILLASHISESQKERIYHNHLPIAVLVEFLRNTDLPRLKEIWLMHISRRHGDGEDFKRRVEAVVPDSVKVRAAIGDECIGT